MQKILIALFAIAFFATFADPAEARRRGAEKETMLFVSNTEITSQDGQTLALCHLVNTHSVFFVNLWRTSHDYVLAPGNCDGNSYFELTPNTLKEAKAEGLIPADVPDTAKLSLGDRLIGSWGLVVGAGVLLFAAIGGLNARARTKQRTALMGTDSAFSTKLLDVMCHAAKADGDIDESEVDLIISASADLTGAAFEREKVMQILELAEAEPSDAAFKAFGKGLSAQEHLSLIEAALRMVAADGNLDGKEQEFIGKLANGLVVPPEVVKNIFQTMIGGTEQPGT